ncbi:hypothetical protein F511_15785 [Dorcoceras hygrometricum]|nr:hypothetical protein F511_15785 [Dorcoceras hygrometricum]
MQQRPATIAHTVRPAHNERRNIAWPRRATSAAAARPRHAPSAAGAWRSGRSPPVKRRQASPNVARTSALVSRARRDEISSIRSTTGDGIASSACTRRPDEISVDGFSSSRLAGTNSGEEAAAAYREERGAAAKELGITDSACKNQLVVVSVQYGPFNPYIPIRSTTIGKSRVAVDPIAMHTSWRSNSDIASVTSIGYPRMSASGESSTTMHRLLHASGSHPIPPPNDLNFYLNQISPGHGNLSLLKTASSLVSPNTAGTSWELKSVKASHNSAQI